MKMGKEKIESIDEETRKNTETNGSRVLISTAWINLSTISALHDLHFS